MDDKTKENLEKNEVSDLKKEDREVKEKKEVTQKKSVAREIMEWVFCIVIAFLLAVCIKFFLFTPTLVMQESMTPNILNGERVLINRMVRTFHGDFQRGDIITFEAPAVFQLKEGEVKATYREVEGPLQSFLYYVLEIGKTSYIKRVIALPGEHVEIKNNHVYINGELLKEDYLADTVETYVGENGIDDFVVPEGYIFAMGDNREGSADCRMFGCVPIEKVEGRVTIRVWPFTKFGKIDN